VADRVDHARARRGEGLLGPLALGPFEEGLVLAEERRVGRLELHRAAVVDGGARAIAARFVEKGGEPPVRAPPLGLDRHRALEERLGAIAIAAAAPEDERV